MLPVALSSACVSVIYTELVMEKDAGEGDEARPSEWLEGTLSVNNILGVAVIINCALSMLASNMLTDEENRLLHPVNLCKGIYHAVSGNHAFIVPPRFLKVQTESNL